MKITTMLQRLVAVGFALSTVNAELLTPEKAAGACPPDGNKVYYNATKQCGFSGAIGDGSNRSAYKCSLANPDKWFCSTYHPKGEVGMINNLGFCCPTLDAYPASYTCEYYKDCASCVGPHKVNGVEFDCGWDSELCIDTKYLPNGFKDTGGNYTFRTQLAQCDVKDTDYYGLYGIPYGTLYTLRGQCAGRCLKQGWADPKANITTCRSIPGGGGSTASSGLTDAQVAQYIASIIPQGFNVPSLSVEPTAIEESVLANVVLQSLRGAPTSGQFTPAVMPPAFSIGGMNGMGMAQYPSIFGGGMGNFYGGANMYGYGGMGGVSSYMSAGMGGMFGMMGRQYGGMGMYGSYGGMYGGYGGMYGGYGNPYTPSPYGPQQQGGGAMSSLIGAIQQTALAGIVDPTTGQIIESSGGSGVACTINNECSCHQDCKQRGTCCSDWTTACPELL